MGHPGLLEIIRDLVAFLEDVERVAAMELHADGAENGANRTRGAALLADDFADVLGRDAETEDGALVAADGLDLDGSRFVYQRLGDFADQIDN
jgi:hypothetical protein